MNNINPKSHVYEASNLIREAKKVVAFTGAGVSVESGIPPFRGQNGLWNTIDPSFIDIQRFHAEPQACWRLIKEIFYDNFGNTKPNPAHRALAQLESDGNLQSVITQNIDGLHQLGGSKNVIEYHGTSSKLICLSCQYEIEGMQTIQKMIESGTPYCPHCGHPLKPDFVFFQEPIPELAQRSSINDMMTSDVVILVGTSGEIYPASQLPFLAKEQGAKIIEFNTVKSNYTSTITDVFVQGKAGETLPQLVDAINHDK